MLNYGIDAMHFELSAC